MRNGWGTLVNSWQGSELTYRFSKGLRLICYKCGQMAGGGLILTLSKTVQGYDIELRSDTPSDSMSVCVGTDFVFSHLQRKKQIFSVLYLDSQFQSHRDHWYFFLQFFSQKIFALYLFPAINSTSSDNFTIYLPATLTKITNFTL